MGMRHCSDCWAPGVVAWGRCYDCAHPILLRRLGLAHLVGFLVVVSFFLALAASRAMGGF